eukprot:gb/GEZN01009874.1/.p1 GENE.gb/GEZN01009874.1/~~gb/GEZN01009874.1/.p1  ORF type:complete len:348 (-),score=36.58 gb/GEZN01009874.1/:221-1264(-)
MRLFFAFATTALFLAKAAHISASQQEALLSVGKWNLQSQGPWTGAEGLMGVAAEDGTIYLSGGRGGLGKQFFNQFYKSKDLGKTWTAPVNPPPWEGRAYHVHVLLQGCHYIIGGQNWTAFYNDVWRSCDQGEKWTQLVQSAPWSPRAGHAALVYNNRIYLCAGSIMPDFQHRDFYHDCWVSTDGNGWDLVNKNSPWSPRSGPRLVGLGTDIFLVAGEDGFTPDNQYNDVWRSSDGCVTWSLVSSTSAWSPRSGHSVVTYQNSMYLVAGWPNLHDLWLSQDGIAWSSLDNATWNCHSESCGRFDFWAVVSNRTLVTFGGTSSQSTFGKMYDTTYACDLSQQSQEVTSL